MDDTKNNLINELKDIESKVKEHHQMENDAVDPEFKKMVREEIDTLISQKKSLEEALNSLNTEYSTDENSSEKLNNTAVNIDNNSVILEIRAGTGGDEAGLFAKDLLRMYIKYGEKDKWKFEELFLSENEMGGIKTITTEVKGNNVYSKLKNESGVHRVQRVPITESGGRIHTSTATVAILPKLNKLSIEIRPDDLKWEFFRSGGHGGQNVNKVSTAVRLTHIPTQTIVECQEERSQGKNRDKALSMLHSKIFNMMNDQQVKSIDQLRNTQIGSGDRSEKIRTYNFPQDRITDHRINKSWHNIDDIFNGGFDKIYKAFDNLTL